MLRALLGIATLAAAAWAGASGAAGDSSAARIGTTPQVAAMPGPAGPFRPNETRVALGRLVFFDARLSEPAGTSCASCHEPGQGFAGNHGSRIGVPLGSRPHAVGKRNTPSALYAAYVPPLFFYQDDDGQAPTPVGGLFGDGRVDSLEAGTAALTGRVGVLERIWKQRMLLERWTGGSVESSPSANTTGGSTDDRS